MGLRRETRKYLLYLRPESAFRWWRAARMR